MVDRTGIETWQNKGRREGNTFRAILRSLIEASNGKDVTFISMNGITRDDAFHRAAGVARMSLCDAEIDTPRRQILIPGGGKVTFVSDKTPHQLAGRHNFIQDI